MEESRKRRGRNGVRGIKQEGGRGKGERKEGGRKRKGMKR